MTEALRYEIVIDDKGSATIKKLVAEAQSAGPKLSKPFKEMSEEAIKADELLKRVGIDYKTLGSLGREMHSQLASSIRATNVEQAKLALSQAGLVDKTKEATKSLSEHHKTLERLQRTALAFLGMWALTKVMGIPKEAIETAFEFNAQIETAKLGIASILMAQGEFTNAVGTTTDAYGQLIMAQKMSGDIIKQLQVDNLKTVATLDQLVKAYQQTLAPALERGFNVKQVREYTVAMVQAAGALGLNLDMMAEETRSMLRGTITPRQTLIATALGITNEDVRKFQGNADGLFNYLMGRLSAFSTAGIESQKTWVGLISNTKDAIKMILGAGFEDLFKFAKGEAKALFDALTSVDSVTGEMRINQSLVEDIRALGKVFEGVYTLIKGIVSAIDSIRPVTTLAIQVWEAFYAVVEKVNKATNVGVGKGSDYERMMKEKYPGRVEDFTPPGQRFLATIRDWGKGVGKFATGGYEGMGFYQGIGEAATYQTRQKPLGEEGYEYLMKVAGATGFIGEALRKNLKTEAESKDLKVDFLKLQGEELQAAMKVVVEYTKLKETNKDTKEAYQKYLDAVTTVASIKTEEQPLKIAMAVAQATSAYEDQRDIIFTLNELEKQKLNAVGMLNPVLREQMDIQTQLAIKEVSRAQAVKSVNLYKETTALNQQYAEMTGNVEDQITSMQDQLEVTVQLLRIEQDRVDVMKNWTEWMRIQDKIMATRRTGEEQIRQAGIIKPIEQMKGYAKAGMDWAAAIGDIEQYEAFSRKVFDYEKAEMEAKLTGNSEYAGFLKAQIELLKKKYEIDLKVQKVEMEVYASDKLASVMAQYGQMTNNLGLQAEAGEILLKNNLKRLDADIRISDKEKEQLKFYLEQVEALQKITRESDKRVEILDVQKQMNELEGNYYGILTKEIEVLEERKRLIETTTFGEERTAKSALVDKQISITKARRDLDIPKLTQYGIDQKNLEYRKELTDWFENAFPKSVDTAGDAFGKFIDDIASGAKSSKDAWKDFVSNFGGGIRKMLIDLAMLIIKMQLMKALGIETGTTAGASKGGGVNWMGIIGSVVGAVSGWLGGGTTGTTSVNWSGATPVSSSGLPIYQHGTDFVPQTGLALLHKGEAVVPAEENTKSKKGSPTNITIVTMDTVTMEQWVRRNSKMFVDLSLENIRRGGELKTAIRSA